MTHRTALFGCALLALTTVLAQDDADEVREVDINGGPPPSEEACFNVREVRSFSALDDRYIYVKGHRDQHFLLTMFAGCVGLGNAIRIAISNNINRVCSIDSAKVTYRGLGQLESCTIRQVEAVEDKAAAEALVELRTRRRE